MRHEDNQIIVNTELIEDIYSDIIFEHHYLGPIIPSKRTFKRNFLVERKRSFYIAGIQFHSYKDIFLDYKIFGIDYYNGENLELISEPWNKYDENAIAIQMMGRKLGYIERDKTKEVWNIMTQSKQYHATFDCSLPGVERINIEYFQEFHDTFSLPYQSDIILKVNQPDLNEWYIKFIKDNIGHTVTFAVSEKTNNMMAIWTDMQSIIGYIDDTFIAKQNKKTPIAGFIENVIADDLSKTIEIKLRLLMKKSVINKNYLKAHRSLELFFGSFYDAGIYHISLADMIRVFPRKSKSISVYEPLVKYLKEYHAIQLVIEN
jgi:hypothetical protein